VPEGQARESQGSRGEAYTEVFASKPGVYGLREESHGAFGEFLPRPHQRQGSRAGATSERSGARLSMVRRRRTLRLVGDEHSRKWVLARRARFVAAALAAFGTMPLQGCGPSHAPIAAKTRVPAVTPAVPTGSSASDRDGDGIPDDVDKCPNEPETFNGYMDEDGCPDACLSIAMPSNIQFYDKILFAPDSASITKEASEILDAIALAMSHHPEILLVELSGHTDERGDDADALGTSTKRAKAVLDALVSRGVDKKRLRTRGYGKYCPVDPGHHEAAWAKNRRVELVVLRTSDGLSSVELGCGSATAHGIKPDPVP
jgi:outer membrane protein OmpA-like peptidoglycan-associated protein